MSNVLSWGPTSLSNSSEYDSPEQPPPFTPMRRYTFSRRCASISCFTCFAAFSVSATPYRSSPSSMAVVALSLGRGAARRSFRLGPLLLVILQGGLDGVLGQDRAMDLD